MVGNALVIADHFQKHGRFFAFRLAELGRADLNQIRAENIFIRVALALGGADFIGDSGNAVRYTAKGFLQGRYGAMRHFFRNRSALRKRKGRRCQQALVQHVCLFLFLRIGHKPADQLFKLLFKRQHQQRAENVENRMNDRNSDKRYRAAEKCRSQNRFHDAVSRQPDGRADHVERKMHHRRALRVFARPDG